MRNRVDLENLISFIFMKNNSNKVLFDAMSEDLKNKFHKGVFVDIYNLRITPMQLTVEQLYVLCKSLYDNYDLYKDNVTNLKKIKNGDEFTSIDKLSPSKYFSENEIIQANEINIMNEKKEEEIYFEISNVDQLYDEEMDMIYWGSTYVPYKELVDNYHRGAILYNFETQRDGEIRTMFGEVIKVPKLYNKNVEQMVDKMTHKSFYSNMITLNIQEVSGMEKQFIEYYPDQRVLRVKKTPESSVYILDGMHRLVSAEKSLIENPNINKGLFVRVLNLNVVKAQAVINQESLGNPLNKETLKKFDIGNIYMTIAKKLNNEGSELTNSLYYRLTSNVEELKHKKTYSLLSTISEAIQDNFKDVIGEKPSAYEIGRLTNFLIEFYNVFLGVNNRKFMFVNIKKTDKFEVIRDVNILAGLLVIARKLYKTENWVDKFENLLNKIDWKRDSWNGIPTNTSNWDKITKEKVYNKFEAISEVL